MDKINKILYLVIVFFLGGLGVHKYLNGRIVPGVVQLVLSFIFGLGCLIALVEFILDIFKCPATTTAKSQSPADSSISCETLRPAKAGFQTP